MRAVEFLVIDGASVRCPRMLRVMVSPRLMIRPYQMVRMESSKERKTLSSCLMWVAAVVSKESVSHDSFVYFCLGSEAGKIGEKKILPSGHVYAWCSG